MAPITATFTAIFAAMLTALAINTTRQRLRYGRDRTQAATEAIRRASRAHGNTLEHALPLLLVLFFAETHGAAREWLCGLGGAFVLARASYVYGMLTRPTSPPMRLGAGATYSIEVAAIGVLVRALVVGGG
ncbi:MAG TPA: MAPEG family protein [Nannocystaceae bacterium]|nr:MAPEG family protein [Nannocystaceae bacterium]